METIEDIPECPEPSDEVSDKDSVPSERAPSMIGALCGEAELSKYLSEEITGLFNSLDTHGRGYLSPSDIKSVFTTFGFETEWEDCRAIIDAFDTIGHGTITYQDFYREMSGVMFQGTKEEHLKLVFDAIDENRDGVFGSEEIVSQFQKVGALIDAEEAMEQFGSIGDDGFISYPEFIDFCNNPDRHLKFGGTPLTNLNIKKDRKKSFFQRKESKKSSVSSSNTVRKISSMNSGGPSGIQ